MNRKILAGAMALALPLSIVGVNAAGAKQKVTKPVPTVITGITFADQSPTLGFAEGSSQIAPFQTATATITGTNLSGVTAGQLGATVKGKGLYAVSGALFTVTAITAQTATSITATVQGATGNNLINSQKSGNLPGALTITLKGAKTKASASLVSNCGPAEPQLATAGKTYGTVDGVVNVAGGITGTSAGLDYFDVSTLGFNLCADDIGSAATTGAPVFAGNYPVQFTSTGSTASSISGVGFTFPYTTNRTLTVSGTSITYSLGNAKAASCAAASTQTNTNIKANHVSCAISGSTITVTDNSDTLNYSSGDNIVGPVINITGLVKKKPTAPVTVTPLGDASTISLAGLNVAINFAPRAKTSNATYVALSSL